MTKNKFALVTGSCGLIGFEASRFFISQGFTVIGIDNDMRSFFFGKEGSTDKQKAALRQDYPDSYIHYSIDIRNEKKIHHIFKKYPIDLIIHTAAQPSHDWAATRPEIDFSINTQATLFLLEAMRAHAPKSVFIFTSTNKVYGDNPNRLSFTQQKLRYELKKTDENYQGITETMSIDNTLHSLFGVSKCAADLLVQEYGKYFGLSTGVFRCGCLTGPRHAAAKQHGFLAYLIKCINHDIPYTIYGYKGKQVRDILHAYDLVTAFFEFYKAPTKGDVYNMGGGRSVNVSMKEAIIKIEKMTTKKINISYDPIPRKGDHVWYISNTSKFERKYPLWKRHYTIDQILSEEIQSL